MITSIELKNETRGLKPFGPISLDKVDLLVGKNGAGKSRLLNLLADYKINDSELKIDDSELKINDSELKNLKLEFDSNKKNHKVINYSHYDALLQSPDKFILNVVSEAKDRLCECNYENTAMDTLLYIYDMAFGYSECYKDGGECSGDFQEFVKIAEDFDITIKKIDNEDQKKLLICGLDINSELLSPGQRYLLRMAVVCFRNKQDNDKKSIFLLDEPEVHLHPDILIATIDKFLNHFENNSQFFIATHSLALMSHFVAYNNETTILWLDNGKTERFRSNTTDLINGLIGSEQNRLAINNLISLPDNYACNIFAAQCCESPQAVSASVGRKDPSIDLPSSAIDNGCTVLDYGAGKCRFIEYLLYNEKENQTLNKIKEYYAFDKYDDDKEICQQIMKNAFVVRDSEYCVDNHYFNDFKACRKALKGKVDYILMVNVLHEIDVNEWIETFSGIKDLLKSDGKLIIVEREELTVGETPYVNGYVMLTKEGVKVLFDSPQVDNYKDGQKERPIVRYIIKKSAIKKLQPEKVQSCLLKMQEEAKEKIQEIHKTYREKDLKRNNDSADKEEIKQGHKLENGRFKDGISLAFWVHQYTNISLILDKK